LKHLVSDKEMLAGVRLKFRDLYSDIEKSADPSATRAEESALAKPKQQSRAG
jgi:hypothetical protein